MSKVMRFEQLRLKKLMRFLMDHVHLRYLGLTFVNNNQIV